MKNDEVSTIIVSPNESLLLRCKKKAYFAPFPVWKKDGKAGNDITLQCSSTVKEVGYISDHQRFLWIFFFYRFPNEDAKQLTLFYVFMSDLCQD